MLVCPGPEHDHVVAHVHECVEDAAAQPLSVCQQYHDGRKPPHDPQHGQYRPHAVPHKGLPALRDELFEKHSRQSLVVSRQQISRQPDSHPDIELIGAVGSPGVEPTTDEQRLVR
jgi:hypothetical protein